MKPLLYIALILFWSCSAKNRKPTVHKIASKLTFCQLLDSIEKSPCRGGFNNYIADAYFLLEKESGIESHANKGTAGIIYFSDSLLAIDIAQWRQYFKCVKNKNQFQFTFPNDSPFH